MASVLEKLVEARPEVRIVQARVFKRGLVSADRIRPRQAACALHVVRDRKGA